jgi:ketosteroid isomerase-like protein
MPTQQTAQDILRCQQRRFEAMVKNDLATLGELLADDLTYTHTSAACALKPSSQATSGYVSTVTLAS